ncbi:RNA polymerase sigma factor [Amnibacterium kyonggiense]
MTTDSEVIRRSRDSPRAFGDLFHRHATVVHRYIARRAGTDVADEVMSETFLVAFERRDRFDLAHSDARPWLLGIATVLLASYRRREARHLHSLARVAEREDDDGGLGQVASRADAVADIRRIAMRVRSLSDGDRDVLLLHAWADLSGEEIATALSIPVGTVRSRLSRARKILRASAESTTSKEADHGRADAAARA